MRRRLRKILFLLILLSACASGEIQPVPFEASDMCSLCKMAISEKRFAAEIITENEEVLKFDDIGCLLRYRQKAENQPETAVFFVDYETQNWIKADNAFFVKSGTIKTPMGSGIVAFADKAKAGNESLRFDELKPRSRH